MSGRPSAAAFGLLLLSACSLIGVLPAADEAPPPRPELPPLGLPLGLVAGGGESGYRDGAFWQARFSSPRGLALDKARAVLYVADSGNNAIRAVDLARGDAVTTLCGGGPSGDRDGLGSAALLSAPTQVALGPDGGSLLFLDQSGGAIRRVDLATGAVVTLTSGPTPGGQAHPPHYSGLASDGAGRFFTVDARGAALRTLDARSGAQATILANPFFAARNLQVAVLGGRFYAYDPDAGRLLSLDLSPWIRSPAPPATPPYLEDAKAGGTGLLPLAPPQGGPPELFTYLPRGDGLVEVRKAGQGRIAWGGPDGPYPDSGPSDLDPLSAFGGLFPGGALSFCADPAGPTLFLSDADGNLLARVDLSPRDDPGYLLSGRALLPKAPGTRRLLFMGHSILTWGTDRQGVLPRRQWFPEQFGQFMDLKRTLRGCGPALDVEVLQKSGGDFPGSVVGSVRKWAPLAAKSQVDELVLVVDQRALGQEALGAFRNTSRGDVADADFDPEWQAAPESAEKFSGLGPLTRRLYAIYQKDPARFHGALEKDPLGVGVDVARTEDAFDDPEVRDLALGVVRKALAGAAEAARRNRIGLRVVLLPINQQLPDWGSASGTPVCADQVSGPLAAYCRRLGIPFLNMVPALRTLEPTLFPLYATVHHLYPRAHQWLGWALAEAWDDPCQAPSGTRN